MANCVRLTGENAADYHGQRFVSQSSIKDFMKSPRKYYERYVARTLPRDPPTEAMQFGLDVEAYLMYGKAPADIIEIPQEVLGKNGAANTNAYREWLAAQPRGARVMKSAAIADLLPTLELCRKSILSHEKANVLVNHLRDTHVGLVWEDDATGLMCKGQLDIVSKLNIICDIKTTDTISINGFARKVFNLGYHYQAWMYREAWRQYTGETLPYVLIAVRNTYPYECETFDLDEEWFSIAEEKMRYYMARIVECYDNQRWETLTHGEIYRLEMPKYVKYSLDEDV